MTDIQIKIDTDVIKDEAEKGLREAKKRLEGGERLTQKEMGDLLLALLNFIIKK